MKLPQIKIMALVFGLLIILKFVHLSNIPIFSDETLYLWLASECQSKINSCADSITFGVMPLQIWLMAVIETITFNLFNPALLGRITTVGLDVLTALFVLLIGRELFNWKFGVISTLVYLLLPLTFFHSGFFLLEPLTNLLVGIGAYCYIRFLKNRSLKMALLTILSLVLAFFTKPLAVVYLPGLSLLPLVFLPRTNRKKTVVFLFKSYLVLLIALLSIVLFFIPVKPQFDRYVTSQPSSYQTFINLKNHLWKNYWWMNAYLTLPVILLTVTGFILGVISKSLKVFWLGSWIFLIILLSCLFSANFFPRHLYPLSIPISLLTAYPFFRVIKFKFCFTLLILGFLPSFLFIRNISQSPKSAPIAPEDKQQLYEDWTSGEGSLEIAQKIAELSKTGDLTIFVENEPSQYWGFQHLYDIGSAKIIRSDNLFQGKFLEDSCQNKITEQSYLVLNKNPLPSADWPVEEILKVAKGPNRSITLYKIIN